jgi:hypothetical protein
VNSQIKLPPALREKILTAKSNFLKAHANDAQARAAADEEIARLEASRLELNGRIAILTREAAESDTAAAELSGCERRLVAISGQLEKLKAALAARPGVSKDEIDSVLGEIILHWMDAVKEAILAALAPFGYPEHLILPLMAHSEAIQILRIMRDLRYSVGISSGKIVEYFDRALAGNVNLNSPVPAEATPAVQP